MTWDTRLKLNSRSRFMSSRSMPGTSHTGRGARKTASSPAPTTYSPRGFHQARGHLGHQLVGGHRPYGIQAEVCLHLPAQPPGNIHGRSEEPARSGGVHKKVTVHIAGLHQGRIRQRLLEQRLHGAFVAVRMGRKDGRVTAQAPGRPQGHMLPNTALVRLFTHIVHHCPGRPQGSDNHRPALQPAVHDALDRHGKIGDV
jgi:hypothetical protein